MNGRDATAAVGGTAIGGDAALWLYDLLQWYLYGLPFDAMPEMPNTVAVGVSGGLIWALLWAASWMPKPQRRSGLSLDAGSGSRKPTPAASERAGSADNTS